MTEVFTRKTTWNRRGKPPILRISHKMGHIRFSVSVVKNFGLNQGDGICFFIDYRDEGVVYFFKDNVRGMKLRFCTKGKYGTNGLQVCCRPMARKILDFFRYSSNKTFDITNEVVKNDGREMWMIQKDKIHRPVKWRKKESSIC